jgi:hypothetical protein
VIGIDMALPCYLWCVEYDRFFADRAARANRSFWKANVLKTDLRDADAVFMFLLPDKIKEKLVEKIERELKPGARVISYTFEIEGWQQVKIDQPSSAARPIFTYAI